MYDDFVWYKIWAVGNGGIPSKPEYVFWSKHLNNDEYEMDYAITNRLGGEWMRSTHWEIVDAPPREAVEKRVEFLTSRIEAYKKETEIHQQWLDSHYLNDMI